VTTGLNKYRALFLSDLHLGSYNCKADRLVKFLINNDAERIYLVGDIIEGNHLKHWPKYHDQVVKILFDKSLNGTEIVYIPGNHDSLFRYHYGTYGNLQIVKNYTHICLDGSLLFVTHGDETDILPNYLWLPFITLLERLTKLGLWELVRRFLSRYIEHHTKKFEFKMRKLGHLNILCGHIHCPKLSDHYKNCGDFTHHCTAIAETVDGKFELLKG
jgi:UDP-2,3-diacylglucosamine pyrophosphatase LpxH